MNKSMINYDYLLDESFPNFDNLKEDYNFYNNNYYEKIKNFYSEEGELGINEDYIFKETNTIRIDKLLSEKTNYNKRNNFNYDTYYLNNSFDNNFNVNNINSLETTEYPENMHKKSEIENKEKSAEFSPKKRNLLEDNNTNKIFNIEKLTKKKKLCEKKSEYVKVNAYNYGRKKKSDKNIRKHNKLSKDKYY